MENKYHERSSRCPTRSLGRQALMTGAFALMTLGASAQVIFNESFTGGASSEGFTVMQAAGTCTWTFNNPGARTITGAGFDADFAIFDSDACGSDADSSAADLNSPVFDASGPGNYILSFDQQYRHIAPTIANVQVWDGAQWTTVYDVTGANVGFPNPAVSHSIDITAATGGSTTAQVRFHYGGDWRWWWALDNIRLETVACAPPTDLAVSNVTTSSATVSWTDNGSAGYQWAVTTGATPNGSNEVAQGDGNDMNITGLNTGTSYTVFVRADCGDGNFSNWSSGVNFVTAISNDECTGAIALTVNPDYNCGATTPGTVIGATDSGIDSECGGTADDDVWFTFTATATQHRISLINITGSTSDMYMALWTGACNNLQLVPGSCSDPQTMDIDGLTAGTQYFLQVYTWTSTPMQTSVFDVCVGTEPFCQPPSDVDLDSVNAGTAVVSWDDNPNAMEYQWELRVSGDPGSGPTGLVDSGVIADSPLTLNGILPNSLYVVYVRSICSVGDTSSWSDGEEIFEGYCNTIDFTAAVEPICNVTFAGIDNDSPPDVDGSPAWEDFTALHATVERGGSYTISATGNTAGPYTTYINAFFDWDQDQVFETMVELGSITDSDCETPVSATVEVPANAVLGTTRMRVVKNFNTAPADPCDDYSFGQAEDYSVDVTMGSGIREAASDGLALWPNPAHDRLMLRNPNGKAAQARIFDLVGNLVMKVHRLDAINIAGLAPGVYILKAQDVQGNNLAHLRFVKQ